MRKLATISMAGTIFLAACTSGGGGQATTPASTQSSPTTAPAPTSADAALIVAMYNDINLAFGRSADNGVRAIIAAQYPEDAADVDFARCVSTMVPRATTLPASKKLRFVPNLATMTTDSGYVVKSDRVKALHPRGRIYATEVTITQGSKSTVRDRHQVVLDGKAYQFSAC